jgi:hypothetical protein
MRSFGRTSGFSPSAAFPSSIRRRRSLTTGISEVIAAKLTAVREGKIRRLIINLPYYIDFVGFIFHPSCRGRSDATFGGPKGENQPIIQGVRRDGRTNTEASNCGRLQCGSTILADARCNSHQHRDWASCDKRINYTE